MAYCPQDKTQPPKNHKNIAQGSLWFGTCALPQPHISLHFQPPLSLLGGYHDLALKSQSCIYHFIWKTKIFFACLTPSCSLSSSKVSSASGKPPCYHRLVRRLPQNTWGFSPSKFMTCCIAICLFCVNPLSVL